MARMKMVKRKPKLTNEDAFKKVELAQIYFEDGAPNSALKLLLEAKKVLGAYTVKPFLKICRAEIKRRKKLFA